MAKPPLKNLEIKYDLKNHESPFTLFKMNKQIVMIFIGQIK